MYQRVSTLLLESGRGAVSRGCPLRPVDHVMTSRVGRGRDVYRRNYLHRIHVGIFLPDFRGWQLGWSRPALFNECVSESEFHLTFSTSYPSPEAETATCQRTSIQKLVVSK